MFALCGRVMLVDKRLSGRHNLYSERCKLQAPAPPSPPLPPSPRARALLLLTSVGVRALQLAFALFTSDGRHVAEGEELPADAQGGLQAANAPARRFSLVERDWCSTPRDGTAEIVRRNELVSPLAPVLKV